MHLCLILHSGPEDLWADNFFFFLLKILNLCFISFLCLKTSYIVGAKLLIFLPSDLFSVNFVLFVNHWQNNCVILCILWMMVCSKGHAPPARGRRLQHLHCTSCGQWGHFSIMDFWWSLREDEFPWSPFFFFLYSHAWARQTEWFHKALIFYWRKIILRILMSCTFQIVTYSFASSRYCVLFLFLITFMSPYIVWYFVIHCWAWYIY